MKRVAARVRGFDGTMGVAAKNLGTGEEISVNGDMRFPTASLIKVAVMVETYHQIAEGKLGRDTVRPLAESDKVGDEPVVLNQLHAGLPLTVSDLLALMIGFSDNTATNMLVGLVGTASVDRRMQSYGLARTKLFRPTFRDGKADVFPELEREFGLGMTTPKEAARLFGLIAEGKVVSRGVSDEMLALMERQQDRAMIPRSLPSSGTASSSRTRPAGTGKAAGRDRFQRRDPDGRRVRARPEIALRDRDLRPQGPRPAAHGGQRGARGRGRDLAHDLRRVRRGRRAG